MFLPVDPLDLVPVEFALGNSVAYRRVLPFLFLPAFLSVRRTDFGASETFLPDRIRPDRLCLVCLLSAVVFATREKEGTRTAFRPQGLKFTFFSPVCDA